MTTSDGDDDSEIGLVSSAMALKYDIERFDLNSLTIFHVDRFKHKNE